ncbi:MAG: hypothetical protein KC729_19395, partial [Candidatus Eisenbacteria bacterium]|nr:hypothetical protein [Candidatus Eisenbacteria bacterium]
MSTLRSPSNPESWFRATVLSTVLTAVLILGGCADQEDRWQQVEIPTDADFCGLWFADSLRGWMTGGSWAIDGGIVG